MCETTMSGNSRPLPCRVCEELEPAVVDELNLIMADPMRWPKTLFEQWPEKPKGLPNRYRHWGALETGGEFLRTHGLEIDRRVLSRHYEYHVTRLAVDVQALARRGMVDDPEHPTTLSAIDPLLFLRYFERGVTLASKTLDEIDRQIDVYIKHDPPLPVPVELLKLAAETGTKLALTGANIQARGQKIGPKANANDAFRRAAGAKKVGPKIGHYRVTVVDGESRPIYDEGPKDRAEYNEKAAREGRQLLP